ncbi:hypothetical protein L6R29_00380 [Myxococcota bacterium]|nr:hypothetical protein [Myxococcota bacterium]
MKKNKRLKQSVLWLFGTALLLGGSLACEPRQIAQNVDRLTKAPLSFIDWGWATPPMPRFAPLRFSDKSPIPPAPALAPSPAPPTAQKQLAALPAEGPLCSSQKLKLQDRGFAERIKRSIGKGRSYRLLLETDKPLYKPSETIWVRGVEIQEYTNDTRQALDAAIFELRGPRGDIVHRHKLPVAQGHTMTAFSLSSDAKGGEYTLHLHFESTQSKAEKKIFVMAYQPPRLQMKMEFVRKGYGPGDTIEATLRVKTAAGVILANHPVRAEAALSGRVFRQWTAKTNDKGHVLLRADLPKETSSEEGTLTAFVTESGAQESLSRAIPLRAKRLLVGFFPEGGGLVSGLQNRVYFSIRREIDQKPQDVEGIIEDSTGTKIAEVRSFYDGMGRFSFVPIDKQTYTLRITRPIGLTERYPLPSTSRNVGLTMRLVDDWHTKNADLQILVEAQKPRQIVVMAMQHEQIIGHQSYTLQQGAQHLKLPLTAQKRGIVRLTLFDAAYRTPLAERLVFRHLDQQVKIEIIPDQPSYQPRQTAHLKLRVTDLQGKPLKDARLGVAVVDDTVLTYADDHEPHLLTQRHLTAQLVGKIYKPNRYFRASNKQRFAAIDLVMGTHGWRDFSWKILKIGRPPKALAALTEIPDTSFLQQPLAQDESAIQQALWLRQNRRYRRFRGYGGYTVQRYESPAEPTTTIQSPAEPSGGIGMRGDGVSGGGTALGLLGGETRRGNIGGMGRGYGSRSRTENGSSPRSKRRAKPAITAPPTPAASPADLPTPTPAARPTPSAHAQKPESPPPARIPMPSPDLEKSPSVASNTQSAPSAEPAPSQEQQRANPDPAPVMGNVAAKQSPPADIVRPISADEAARPKKSRARRVRRSRRGARGKRDKARRRWSAADHRGMAPPTAIATTPTASLFARLSWQTPRVFPIRFYAQANTAPTPPAQPTQAQAPTQRTDFRETLYWNPLIKTDAWGEAKISFGLNDSITSFRILTTSVGGGYIGRKTHTIASKRPFFLAVRIPNEVSSSDAMVLPITLRNDSKTPLTLHTKLQISHHFKLLEDPFADGLTLQPNEGITTFLPLRVQAPRGEGSVSITATSQGLSDAISQSIRIRPRGFPRQIGVSGTLRNEKTQQFALQLPPARDFTNLHTQLKLYTSSLQGMTQAAAGMLRYPSGCFEQTSATNYPNIMALRYLKQKRIDNPALYARAHRYLASGYRRLISFEIRGGGFDWYGSPPADEALSAYGLLQFLAMREVYPVSKALLERTRRWLKSRRNGNGGFRTGRSYGDFGNTSRDVHNAYITFALFEAGERDLSTELSATQHTATKSQDAYLLALATLATQHANGPKSAQASAYLNQLLKQRRAGGHFQGRRGSFVGSYGRNLAIETTSFAILAMLRARMPEEQITPSLSWLQQQRSMYGRYGATQATVLALQALAAFEQRFPSTSAKYDLLASLDDTPFFAQTLDPQQSNVSSSIYKKIPLHPGKNQLNVSLKGKANIPFSAHASFYIYTPPSAPNAPIHLEIEMSKRRLKLGEITRLSASILNKSDQPQAMTLARIAFPGGLTPQIWQLKELKEKNIVDFYELHPRELIVYLRQMEPKARRTLHLDLVAHVTGNYTGPASSAYPYYNDDLKFWQHPLRISIVP